MTIQQLRQLYDAIPQTKAFEKLLTDQQMRNLFLKGLAASSAPLFFASFAERVNDTILFILNDNEEAGYFYHDLTQMIGTDDVLFFPSSYKRAVKYAQRDAANDILRTEVLTRLSAISAGKANRAYIVTCPEALCQLVVSQKALDERTLSVRVGQTMDLTEVRKTLRTFGFVEQDYVYEPGQFAMRGSILDVYSYSCEFPFRIDFFGDDVDTIRTFDIQSQLSKEMKDSVEIVPEISKTTEKMPFGMFLPEGTFVAVRDYAYVCDTVARVYEEGFSSQAVTVRLEGATEQQRDEIMMELQRESQLISQSQFIAALAPFRRIDFGKKPMGTPQATISFNISSQPLFHKNFSLLTQTMLDYRQRGYRIFVLSDSEKQIQRLRDIMAGDEDVEVGGPASAAPPKVEFEAVDKTLHEGFTDNDNKLCLFTDHQIFDRFHKYSLKSDTARAGKMALTMKELQEMEPGDFIVHVDFGIGRFQGLVRIATGDSYQEMIRIVYQRKSQNTAGQRVESRHVSAPWERELGSA